MSLNKKDHLTRAKKLYSKYNSSEKAARELCKELSIEYKGHYGRLLRKWFGTKLEDNIDKGTEFKLAQLRKSVKSKYFLITSAQNATPVNKELLLNMKAYSEYLGGTIEVIPIRYKNPTSTFTDKKYDWWHPDTHPYLIANRHNLNKNLVVLGDVKSQPTASTPLAGMESITGLNSAIIGHPRQHLKTLPVLEGYDKKILLSTGSLTIQNYTDSRAGKAGEFHHTFGFIIVEIKDNDTFYVRHVSADKNGSFHDLDIVVEKGKVKENQNNVDAIVFGDLHLGEHDDDALMVSYSMLDRFNPKNLILHDIFSGYSVNPHERKDPFKQLENEQNGNDSIIKEIDLTLRFLDSVLKFNPVVVGANHNNFVDRFLTDVDWRKEANKKTYLKYASLKANNELPNGIVAYEIQKKFGKKVVCLTEDSSFIVKGIELGVHSHLGSGGSRGTFNQFKKLSTKIVIGHGHTPTKEDGATMVGTLTKLRVGYNKGLSNWMHSNVIVHSNGKVQNLLIVKGKYTTL